MNLNYKYKHLYLHTRKFVTNILSSRQCDVEDKSGFENQRFLDWDLQPKNSTTV